MSKVAKQINFDVEELQAIDEMAVELSITRAQFVRMACNKYVRELREKQARNNVLSIQQTTSKPNPEFQRLQERLRSLTSGQSDKTA